MNDTSSGRSRILLVEDNETIRRAFQILLEESGYEVSEASSGGDAVDVARRSHPDLILLDLGLPDASGIDVVRKLKEDPVTSGSAVIAVTGRALETDRDACLAAGCTAYLSKPINTASLLATIAEHLESGSSRD